ARLSRAEDRRQAVLVRWRARQSRGRRLQVGAQCHGLPVAGHQRRHLPGLPRQREHIEDHRGLVRIIIEVTVVPGSRKFSISEKDGTLRIRVRAPAEKNRANIELIKELSALPGTTVRILSAATSRRKRLEIGISEKEWKDI